jgi:hypothetical protein
MRWARRFLLIIGQFIGQFGLLNWKRRAALGILAGSIATPLT